jgi:MFS family permease
MSVQGGNIRFLIAGFVINLTLGVLYGWSILIEPLEEFFDIDRSTLSIVPAIGLLFFTIGVFVHDRFTRWFYPAVLASGVMLSAGFGHLLFYLYPYYLSLLVGYGVIFGLSAGVGYGLALAFARNVPLKFQGWAVGSTVAAFAIGGMLVSVLATLFTIPEYIPNAFGLTSILYIFMPLFLGAVLRRLKIQTSLRPEAVEIRDIVKTWYFLRMAFTYFVMSYIGLMIVSHGATLMHELGISVITVSLTPFTLNAGYVFGAILGGIVITRYPIKLIPMVFLFISITSLCVLLTAQTATILFSAIFGIGLVFGSTVSIFVVLLSRCYGEDHAGDLFGRINIGYGLAGFIAPIVTAHLYELNGSYNLPMWTTIILGCLGFFALLDQTGAKQ